MLDISDENIIDDSEDNDNCICNGAHKIRYRVIRGSSIEGLSVREVAFDDQEKIIGWGYMPSTPPEGSIDDLREGIDSLIDSFIAMKESLELPIIDELELEMQTLNGEY